MKNIIMLVAILTLFIGSLVAQPAVGMKIGLNMANIGGDKDMENNDAIFGAHGGFMMQYPMIPEILLQGELLYTMKGYSFKVPNFEYDNSSNSSIKVSDRLQYLEVPLLFKYNLVSPNIKIQPYLGPSVGLLLAASQKLEYTGDNAPDDHSYDIKKYMNDIDLGMNIGADVVIMENLIIGLRYNHGLTKIFDGSTNTSGNRVFMLSFGYLIPLDM